MVLYVLLFSDFPVLSPLHPLYSMKKILVLILYSTLLIPLATGHTAEKADKEKTPITELTTPVQAEPKDKLEETAEMLNSLLELQQGLQEQIKLSKKELKSSSSDTEKSKLQEELQKLDRQLSDTNTDFERIATGVESALFVEKAPETFNWKEEIASLVEPAIKELKRLTIRARQRTHLKESINELDKLTATASAAVSHLEELLTVNQDKKVNKKLNTLLPEWKTILNRLERKRELAQMELNQLNQQDGSLVEHSRKSVRTFFKDRGRFLVISLLTFSLSSCSVDYCTVSFLSISPESCTKERNSAHFRSGSLTYSFRPLHSFWLSAVPFWFFTLQRTGSFSA